MRRPLGRWRSIIPVVTIFMAIPSVVAVAALQVSPSNATLNGRVTDPTGRRGTLPTAGIVAVGVTGYRDGHRVFLQRGVAQSDSAGNYRLSVQPGEYYVRAETAALRGFPTYYPGTLDLDAAVKISTQSAQEVVGVDFEFKAVPTFKVSGTIFNVPTGTGGSVLGMTFVSADPKYPDTGAGLLPDARGGLTSGTNVEFEVQLPSGLWDLFPVIPNRGAGTPVAAPVAIPSAPTYLTGRVRVLVADRNVENATVTVGSWDVRGRVISDGATPTLSGIVVSLVPKNHYPASLLLHVRPQLLSATGEFSFTAVPSGQFMVQISATPSDMYVADLRVGSKSVYEEGFIEVGTGPLDPVEVVLKSGGGTVGVTLDTAATATPPIRTVLVPAAPRRGNAMLYKNQRFVPGQTTADIHDVAPGRYKAFVFQDLPDGGAERNAEFIARYENSGVLVDVVSGRTSDVNAGLIRIEE